jgi:hypothetical protein
MLASWLGICFEEAGDQVVRLKNEKAGTMRVDPLARSVPALHKILILDLDLFHLLFNSGNKIKLA